MISPVNIVLHDMPLWTIEMFDVKRNKWNRFFETVFMTKIEAENHILYLIKNNHVSEPHGNIRPCEYTKEYLHEDLVSMIVENSDYAYGVLRNLPVEALIAGVKKVRAND